MKLSEAQYEELRPRVVKAAAWVARRRPDLAADVASEIWAEIVARAMTDAAFLGQTPSYIVWYGGCMAGHWLDSLLAAERRDGNSLDAPAGRDDAGDGQRQALGELLADTRAGRGDPAEFVPPRLALLAALAGLQPDRVAYGLAAGALAGYRPAEIAAGLGVTKMAMTYAKARVAAALATLT
jgi:hypothetical protein